MVADRKPIRHKPDPLVRDELWGYRRGQLVEITNCGGKYTKVTGTWVFQHVRLNDSGEPIEVTVIGGRKNKESTRTFPVERLKPPPKYKRGTRRISSSPIPDYNTECEEDHNTGRPRQSPSQTAR